MYFCKQRAKWTRLSEHLATATGVEYSFGNIQLLYSIADMFRRSQDNTKQKNLTFFQNYLAQINMLSIMN